VAPFGIGRSSPNVVPSTMDSIPEVWLRGPLPDVPPLLQPVAHGLMQCREEFQRVLASLTPAQLAERPAGVASVGFHVRHAIGALDRLLGYARGESLSDAQQAYLDREPVEDTGDDAADRLSHALDEAIDRALRQVRSTDVAMLLEPRVVGRQRLSSTVIGLLFHAAEHTQRHAGQCATTARIVRGR